MIAFSSRSMTFRGGVVGRLFKSQLQPLAIFLVGVDYVNNGD